MKGYLFSLALLMSLFFPITNSAQNQAYIDSLNQKLVGNTVDSLRVQIYGKLCWHYAGTRVHTDVARKYADSIKRIADLRQNPFWIAKYHYYYGVLDRLEGHYYEGLSHLQNYTRFYESKGDSSKVAGSLYQMATIHDKLGNYEEGLKLYYRVLNIEQTAGDSYSEATALNSIGVNFKETFRHSEALEQFKKAYQLFDSLDAQHDLSNVLVNMGNTEIQLRKFEEARIHYDQALKINRQLDNPWGEAMSLGNIAFLYDHLKHYDSALHFHLQALAIREALPSQEDLARSLMAVGHGYLQISQYSKSHDYLQKALDIALQIESRPIQSHVYTNFTNLFARQKQFEKAFGYYQKYHEVEQSLLDESKSKQLAELTAKYETAQKEQEITLLSSENQLYEANAQRQATVRNALIGGVLLLGIIAGLIWYNMRQRLKSEKALAQKNEEIKVSNLKEQLTSLEFKALRAQMNPHFLFNCLNSINRMIMSNDNHDASRYLTKFSRLVRLILENSEQPEVALKDELDMLEAYIQLESIRFKNRIEHHINVDPTIDQESCQLPSMVLQPFVENAIWHGLLPQDQKGELTINIAEIEDVLQCTIRDNGIGRAHSTKIQQKSGYKKKSMGIKITDERLKLLNKKELTEVIKITDLKDSNNQPMGTEVNVLIPIS